MKSTLRFHPVGGLVNCLYTEAINLSALGRLHVIRATDIRFSASSQQWEVHDAVTDDVLFSNPSRGDCLAWEQQNLQPTARHES